MRLLCHSGEQEVPGLLLLEHIGALLQREWAFFVQWSDLLMYAFSPIPLQSHIPKKIKVNKTTVILTPWWTRQFWFTMADGILSMCSPMDVSEPPVTEWGQDQTSQPGIPTFDSLAFEWAMDKEKTCLKEIQAILSSRKLSIRKCYAVK